MHARKVFVWMSWCAGSLRIRPDLWTVPLRLHEGRAMSPDNQPAHAEACTASASTVPTAAAAPQVAPAGAGSGIRPYLDWPATILKRSGPSSAAAGGFKGSGGEAKRGGGAPRGRKRTVGLRALRELRA